MSEKTTAKKIHRTAKMSDIKVLTDESKNLIENLSKEFSGKCCKVEGKEFDVLRNGYIGQPSKEHFKSSFMYSLARVLSVLGYAKRPVGKDKVLIEDIKRIGFDNEKKIISFDFRDKNNFIK